MRRSAVPVGAAAQPPGGDTDLHVGHRHVVGDLEQPQRGLAGTRRVVLVGDRRAEDAVQVGALVADGQLQHGPALLVERPLGARHEVVEHRRRLRVARRSRARRTARTPARPGAGRRGTRLARPPSAPTPAGSSHWRATSSGSSRPVGGPSGGRGCVHEGLDDTHSPSRRLTEHRPGRRARPRPPASSTTSPAADCRSAAASESMRRPASTSISWTSGSPTTKRCTPPTATATFTPRVTGTPPGVETTPTRAITSCIASAHAVARTPSSPSIHAVTASPLK